MLGGYDTRESENVICHRELEALVDSFNLRQATVKNLVSALNVPPDIEVLFLLSVPSQLKSSLLNAAKLLIYTPSNEHFGIVPLEAMLVGLPVLAANSGGPLETVVDSETGWLRSADKVEQWTDIIHQVLYKIPDSQLQRMGDSAKNRVIREFSETKMAHRFDEEIEGMIKARRIEATELGDVALSIPILGVCFFTIGAVVRIGLTNTDLHTLEIALGTALLTLAFGGIFGIIYRLLQNESAFM